MQDDINGSKTTVLNFNIQVERDQFISIAQGPLLVIVSIHKQMWISLEDIPFGRNAF